MALEVDINTLGMVPSAKPSAPLSPPAKPVAAAKKAAGKAAPVANGTTRAIPGGAARGGTVGAGPTGRAADPSSKAAKDPAKLKRDAQLAKEAEVR